MHIIKKPDEMIRNFYPLLLKGDIDEIKKMFAGEPLINEPTKGIIQGVRALEHFTGNYRQWMQRRNPKPGHVAVTVTEERIVEEFVLHLQFEQEYMDLPVAVAGDLHDDKFTCIRIYHSTWPLFKSHMVRPPIVTHAENLALPPLVEAYMERLAQGDAESIIALFEPDGYVRESGGEKFKHAGQADLSKFYSAALAKGGILLKPCTCTHDGTKCAVEYNMYRWGETELPPQAGIAVYEAGSGGRIAAARMYDDINPPFETS